MSNKSKPLHPLKPGDQVAIQNQTGNNPRQWLHTGVVIEVGPYNSYHVSVDGSRTITKRNRQYLRKISPFQNLPTPSTPPPTPSQAKEHPKQPTSSPQHDDHRQADKELHQHHRHVHVEDEQAAEPTPSSHVTPPPAQPDPSPQPQPPRKLPQHLRERWIVAAPKPNPPIQDQSTLGSMATVKHEPAFHHPYQPYPQPLNLSHIPQHYTGQGPYLTQPYPAYTIPMMHQNVAQTLPNVLPYNMMPQQDIFSPMMYKPYSSY